MEDATIFSYLNVNEENSMDWIEVIKTVLQVIAIFAGVSTVTPNSSRIGSVDKVLKGINLAGLNFGKACNR